MTNLFQRGALEEKGLALQAALLVSELPPWALEPMVVAGFDLKRATRLVMIGQAGPALWEYMEEASFESEDRFDDFVTSTVEQVLVEQFPECWFDIVYPGPTAIPLGRLAQLVRWGHPSPLGLSVHQLFGPWTAHRLALLTDADVPITHSAPAVHPCDTCSDQPCVTACPAAAVSVSAPFDVVACSSHRIVETSACAYQCVARNACPVGAEHRYGPAQMKHHYQSSLDSIRRFASEADERA